MIDFSLLLRRLHEHRVNFVIIGGVAAVIHGSSFLTQDLDIVYQRSDDNKDLNVVAELEMLFEEDEFDSPTDSAEKFCED